MRNEEFHILYSPPNIIRIIKSKRARKTGQVERMGEKGNACRIFVGKPEGKRLLGRNGHCCEDNIKIYIMD
jgi:hypothetical protein